MEVRLCRGEEPAWDAFVGRCERASVFHLQGWKGVFERAYGHKGRYLMALENGAVQAVLPLVQLGGGFFPEGLVSLPFVDPGGICEDGSRSACESLAREAFRLARTLGVSYLQVRQRPGPVSELRLPQDDLAMPRSHDMILELLPDAGRMWERIPSNRRRQIKRAQERGLTARWTGADGLDAFYGVLSENMRDLGAPFHGRRFFREAFAAFPSRAKLLLVERRGQTVAAALCLFFRDTLLLPWFGGLRRHADSHPNVFLHWTAIEFGCRNGYGRLDFGRAPEGQGHFQYKSRWGISPAPLAWWGARFSGRPLGFLNRDIARPWRRLPLWAADWAGPRLKGALP